MATYYVWSDAGGSNNGSDWTNAYVKLASAATAASTANDIIKVHKTHAEEYTVAETITFAANGVRVLCVDKDASDALDTGAVLGAQTGNFALTMAGAFSVYIRGLTLRNGNSAGSGGAVLATNATDGNSFVYDLCTFVSVGTGGSARIAPGVAASTSVSAYTIFRDCTFTGVMGLKVGIVEMIGCQSSGGFSFQTDVGGSGNAGWGTLIADGCDFSSQGSGTLFVGAAAVGGGTYTLSNCKLHTGTVLGSQTVNKSQLTVWLFNCASGDTHYHIAHYDTLGSTTVSASIYANDGAKYDGTNGCSWVVASTAYASFTHPYVSPWIDKYHAGTSAITPTLEILRDGSATAYQNDEVWGEFSYQGTSGSTRATIVNDRMALLGSPADQTTGSLNASGWTGENATAWFGKLNPTATITPAEIGHLRARVCVGEPSITVYVDPKIRVA